MQDSKTQLSTAANDLADAYEHLAKLLNSDPTIDEVRALALADLGPAITSLLSALPDAEAVAAPRLAVVR